MQPEVRMKDPECETAFPTLSESERSCVARIGSRRTFHDGEVLIEIGDRDFPFYAVTSGEIVILESSTDEPREVVVHGPGQFSGDVSMLTGRPALVSAVARGETEVVEVPAARVRQLLNEIPDLSDKLLEAFQMRRELLEAAGFVGIRVIGESNSKETLELREFCYKNKVPHKFEDIEEETGKAALEALGLGPESAPVIACSKSFVARPTLPEFAECLGISRAIPDERFDVTIVGAGPAGLGAAVYAGSEGLKTLLLDRMGPGGQTGQSSKIENYLGFPSGLPGAELGNRGYLQALKFGVEFRAPFSVHRIERREAGDHVLTLCNGQSLRSRTILIATGASYRRLPVENSDRFEGAGVYYAATSVEARVCRGATAIVVGGGNSAGQAAMYLARQAANVKLVLRGDDLRARMSDYLCRRIEHAPNIEVMLGTVVESLHGDRRLSQVVLHHTRSGERRSIDCAGLFSFVGAHPHTEWLDESFAKDEYGFLRTGAMVASDPRWTEGRTPCELETTHPGVFAAGDVRSGTTKRCAFAVGDGALAVTCVHWFLGQ
jgi:thioredoxin reductase (NADPH)